MKDLFQALNITPEGATTTNDLNAITTKKVECNKLKELKQAKQLILKNFDILISKEEEQLYFNAIKSINALITDYKINNLYKRQ